MAFGDIGIRPIDWIKLSYRDYINILVGFKDRLRREEWYWREINYNIVRGYADPKKMPSKNKFWHIDGEKSSLQRPTSEQLKNAIQQFRNLGKKKDG